MDFADKYNMSNNLYNKLTAACIKGPHLLPRIKDEQLENAGLAWGEIAEVRDAFERWEAGLGLGVDG